MRGRGQEALEHVKASFPVVDHVDEFSFDQLAVVVGNGVFERVLVALFALTFVASRFKAATQNGNALE